MQLAGIDGCKTGWVAVVGEVGKPASARLIHVTDLPAFLGLVDFALIDMPVGFVAGPKTRDVEPALRDRLKGKGSSVFPTPCRQALVAQTYAEACAINVQVLGSALPKQSYMIFPKMRELDAIVREIGQKSLREGHPEASFALMAGAPVRSKKREAAGQADRVALLTAQGLPAKALLEAQIKGQMAPDDILDAAALWWSADRHARGKHETFPPVPSRDAVGLEMSVIA
ncbi:DUF429 domain-containing protein [Rhodobacter sp. KR11]|uniref:DUF429 domain-containing protein n=1 Tax=Rhodobacter sp. KR11 TaxID=2974588 RepID=UPI002221A45B|nr:DUF429 domain-containing protein [Rhodobacter sp. KR11]MCW1919248.1 DUF429 domain-containing protein [Rhodobacter sp. KR11]